jgi:4-amino-4-deoxy-L-arabinose transferase-like glycosyltransferase
MPGSARQFAIGLIVLSFALRLTAVLAMRDVGQGPSGSVSADDVQFHHLALHLSAGQGYVNDAGRATAFRAPGFPFFLAAVYWLTGDVPPLVYVLNCLLGAAGCVLAYLIGREVFSEVWARWAGVLAACYLGHVYFAAVYASENLFVPFLALGVWLLLRFLRNGSPTFVLLAGLALGVATLARPGSILLLGLLPPVLWMVLRRQHRPTTVPLLIFGCSFLAVIAPWTCRNYQRFHRVVLVATNGGSTFYGGNNDRVVSEPRLWGYWVSTTDLPHRDWIDAQPDEVAHDKMEWKLGTDWLRQHPGKIPLLLTLKFARMWWLPDFDSGRFYYLLRIVAYFPFLLLFLLAGPRLLRERTLWSGPWLIVHATMLATILTVLIFWGCPRFRDANLPFLMLYAVLGLQVLARPAAGNSERCL